MMRILISILVIMLTFAGCGDKNSRKKQQEKIKQEQGAHQINDYLTLIMKVKLLEDDVFEIYYAEDLESTYIPEERVQVIVQGKNKFQEIKFRFPERVYPLKLRIDLGLNKNETNVDITEIRLSTGGKSVKLSTEEIVKRFRLNKYISYNIKTNSFNRKIVDDTYDPLMLSGNLTKEITDIFSE